MAGGKDYFPNIIAFFELFHYVDTVHIPELYVEKEQIYFFFFFQNGRSRGVFGVDGVDVLRRKIVIAKRSYVFSVGSVIVTDCDS